MNKYLHVESTSRCNAACPMCERNINGIGTSGTFDPSNLTLEKFKQVVTPSLPELEKVLFCGNLGDPCANRNLLEFIEWLKSEKDVVIGINTNGSIQNSTWWARCALLLTNPLDYVVFSIDGLKDTNHIYRWGVPYHKIMENSQSFIDAGGIAHWDMLVFDHNKHQIDACLELATKMGFCWFRAKETDRWDIFDFEFDVLEPVQDHKNIDYTTVESIQCERNIDSSSYVDHQGNIFPCCHLANAWYSRNLHDDVKQHELPDLMQEYQKRLDENDPFFICKRSCGTTTNWTHQYKKVVQIR